LIYATFLVKDGRETEATKQLEVATAAATDNAFTQYNAGMIYFDMRNYDKALVQAHRAYGLGFEQPALRDQLQSAGKWSEQTELPQRSPAESMTQEGAPDTRKSNAAPNSNDKGSAK
jgi:predicted Zn-dependent protease